jgi:ABC-type Mn2+/Zn2+ transport system ATPase subunit
VNQRELLRLDNVAFGYGRKTVLTVSDLVVRSGDFYGIIGPNGAGKTTLLRGLLGTIRPISGQVTRAPFRLGYVPQRESLDEIFPVTVRELIEMSVRGRVRGKRGVTAADRETCDRLLDRVGLPEHSERLFSSLSGGQRQRALIARALLLEPQLLLLDEPTSGVDHAAIQSILKLLLELHQEGLAILLVSHQLELLRDSVAEVLMVTDGQVRRGSCDEFLNVANYAGRLTNEPIGDSTPL